MATQNPIEQEGTYPLPEAQLDRFLMHVLIGYPDEASEREIIRLVRGEEAGAAGEQAGAAGQGPDRRPSRSRQFSRPAPGVHAVHVADAIEQYMVDLVFATRYPDRYEGDLRKWIQVGASPRGGLALDRCSRPTPGSRTAIM